MISAAFLVLALVQDAPVAATPPPAEPRGSAPAEVAGPDAARQSIDRAVEYLLAAQRPDGSFGTSTVSANRGEAHCVAITCCP